MTKHKITYIPDQIGHNLKASFGNMELLFYHNLILKFLTNKIK